MTDSPERSFNPRRITEMFRAEDLAALLDTPPLRKFSPDTLRDAQQRNMAALVSIQRTSAARYQDLFEKQIEAIDDILDEAERMHLDDSEPATDAYQAAVQAAASLAAAAREANTEALETLRAEIKATAEQLATSAE